MTSEWSDLWRCKWGCGKEFISLEAARIHEATCGQLASHGKGKCS